MWSRGARITFPLTQASDIVCMEVCRTGCAGNGHHEITESTQIHAHIEERIYLD